MPVEQGSMFPALVEPRVDGLSIQEAFEAFHAANPWVLDELVAMAREYRDRGWRRIGAKALVEWLRYRAVSATVDPTCDYKINNNYTSRYARLIVARHPDLADMFCTRQLRAA